MTKLKMFAQHLAEQFYVGYPIVNTERPDRIPPTKLTCHWEGTVKSAAKKMGQEFRAQRDGRFDGSLYERPDGRRVIARLEWEHKGLVLFVMAYASIMESMSCGNSRRHLLSPRQLKAFFHVTLAMCAAL
jgi:hypothetical protein